MTLFCETHRDTLVPPRNPGGTKPPLTGAHNSEKCCTGVGTSSEGKDSGAGVRLCLDQPQEGVLVQRSEAEGTYYLSDDVG